MSAEILRTEFSEPFVQGMRDRMVMSFYKYGAVKNAYPSKVNAIESLEMRLKEYQETGNTEFLIDAANFAMIEFMRPSHVNAHFSPTDSKDSPGRYSLSDGKTDKANDQLEDFDLEELRGSK